MSVSRGTESAEGGPNPLAVLVRGTESAGGPDRSAVTPAVSSLLYHRYSIPTGISNACAFQYILYYELILHPRYGLNIKRCLATSSLLS